MTFVPELGQMAFSNTPWRSVEMQWHVEEGLSLLACLIQEVRGDDSYGSLVSNSGGEPWEGATFALRAYCWCDGGQHPDDCPPNFEYRPAHFTACWYKHVGRGNSQSRALSVREWVDMLGWCIREVKAVHP